jgi:hypothetical protein
MSQINSGKDTSSLGCDIIIFKVKHSKEIGFLGLLDPNDEGTEILPYIKTACSATQCHIPDDFIFSNTVIKTSSLTSSVPLAADTRLLYVIKKLPL